MSFTVNSYFDDKVRSIAFESANGPCTSGVMAPGEQTFNTSQHEVMKVMEGEMTVKLPGSGDWQSFKTGTEFTIDANLSFDVKIETPTAYLCFYSQLKFIAKAYLTLHLLSMQVTALGEFDAGKFFVAIFFAALFIC